jgi:DNA-binding XRE family transcriptional regulator
VADLEYKAVPHDHKKFLKRASKQEGFVEAYDALEEEYALARELLAARSRSGLTQEGVADLMGTTKSAVSRLESGGKTAPSLKTLKKYAKAVGCRLHIRLIPATAKKRGRNDR